MAHIKVFNFTPRNGIETFDEVAKSYPTSFLGLHDTTSDGHTKDIHSTQKILKSNIKELQVKAPLNWGQTSDPNLFLTNPLIR